MIKIKCPACTVEFEAEDGTQSVICEYCGTRIDIAPPPAVSEEAPAEVIAAEAYAEEPAREAPAEDAAAEPVPAAPAYSPVPEEPVRKKKGKGGLIALIIVLLLILGGGAFAYLKILKPANGYKAAEALLADGDYDGAAEAFAALGDYKDAAARIDDCVLKKAEKELGEGKYSRAARTLKDLSSKSAADNAVYKAFAAALKKPDPEGAGRILAEFSGVIADTDRYEEAAEEEMKAFLDAEDDGNAAALYQAFEGTDAVKLFGDAVKEKLDGCMQAGNTERMKSLIERFGAGISDMEAAVKTNLNGMINQGKLDEAAACMESLSSYGYDLDAEKYSIGKALLEKGDYEKAAAAFEALGGYEDSAELAKEAQYQSIMPLLQKKGNELTPEEYTAAYRALRALDGYSDSELNLRALICIWYANILAQEDPEPYQAALQNTVSLTAEEKEVLWDYILSRTPDLTVMDDNGKVWYGKLKDLEKVQFVMDLFFSDADAPDVTGFRKYLRFMHDYQMSDLPTTEEAYELWDLRKDFRLFCSFGKPLFAFLTGSWSSGKAEESMTMTRKSDGHYSLHYELPIPKVSGTRYLDALGFGLSLVDGDNELARICEIEIVDFSTINLENKEDGTVCTMTRQAE